MFSYLNTVSVFQIPIVLYHPLHLTIGSLINRLLKQYRLNDPKLQEPQNTEIQKYRNTEIKKYRNTEIQKYRNTERKK